MLKRKGQKEKKSKVKDVELVRPESGNGGKSQETISTLLDWTRILEMKSSIDQCWIYSCETGLDIVENTTL